MAWEFRYEVDEDPCEICLGAVRIESKTEGSAQGPWGAVHAAVVAGQDPDVTPRPLPVTLHGSLEHDRGQLAGLVAVQRRIGVRVVDRDGRR
jgi:hypothetical protein